MQPRTVADVRLMLKGQWPPRESSVPLPAEGNEEIFVALDAIDPPVNFVELPAGSTMERVIEPFEEMVEIPKRTRRKS